MASHTYNCSQQHLYIIARMAWHSCNKYLTAFNKFSPRYTPAYITSAIAQIDAAEHIASREQATKLLYVQLVQQAKTALWQWQKLKLYITDAFPQNELQIHLNAAGYPHYRKASRKYWSDCTQLLNHAETFITNNQAQLSANGNMPPAFISTFTTEKDKYTNLLRQYYESAQSNPVNTQQKILANNAIHQHLMSMMLDGQRIFIKDAAVKKLFVFDQLHIPLIAHRKT